MFASYASLAVSRAAADSAPALTYARAHEACCDLSEGRFLTGAQGPLHLKKGCYPLYREIGDPAVCLASHNSEV